MLESISALLSRTLWIESRFLRPDFQRSFLHPHRTTTSKDLCRVYRWMRVRRFLTSPRVRNGNLSTGVDIEHFAALLNEPVEILFSGGKPIQIERAPVQGIYEFELGLKSLASPEMKEGIKKFIEGKGRGGRFE